MSNYRRLGALPISGGGSLVANQIVRSAQPCDFAVSDRDVFLSHRIQTVVDLRSSHERQRYPSTWLNDQSLSVIYAAIARDLRVSELYRERLRQDLSEQGATNTMRAIYSDYPVAAMHSISQLCHTLLARRGPVLVHCAAGKDRTGFVIAMLLEAIGVEREAIMHDYLLSNDHVAGDIEQQRQRLMVHFQLPDHMSPPDGVVSALMGVNTEYLEAAYAAIYQQFTTVDGYLAAAGITPTKREQLTRLLCRG